MVIIFTASDCLVEAIADFIHKFIQLLTMQTMNQSKPIFLGFSALILASTVSLPAQAINLITNGGLVPSQAVLDATGSTQSYRNPFPDGFVNTTDLPGWTLRLNTPNNDYSVLTPDGTAFKNSSSVSGKYAFPLNADPGQTVLSPTGSGWFLQMDGDPQYAARLEQTVAGLTVGQAYILTFYQAAGSLNDPQFSGATTDQFTVTFGSDTQVAPMMSLADQQSVIPWSKQTMTFTATSTSQVLSFLNVGTPAGQPPVALLSGISVEAVPWETDTLPLVGSTVIFGLGLWARNKAAQKKLK